MITDAAPVAGNVPAEPNSFIGRERDLAELVAMLDRVRALTLCGPGGIGKTRLALRLATALAASYPDGVFIAQLGEEDVADVDASEAADGQAGASATGIERVVLVVTSALRLRPEVGQSLAGTLTEALRSRRTLLILDTCEHLVQSCAELVSRLLADCPGLSVIATSREPLRIRGEVIWRVPPLGLPEGNARGDAPMSLDQVAASEAVRLFVDRAAAVRPGFVLDDSNAAAVASICRTLDGVPLAIELAAARVRALSAAEISSRLADRFELLALGDRAAPARHQTLRATVEWSYELLTPSERLLLSRLSVFHGWSLEMAERVCSDDEIPSADVLLILTALIDKSLVSLDGDLDGTARYRLLDTVREIAAEQAVASGEMVRLRTVHRNNTLRLSEELSSRAFMRGDPPWPERVVNYRRARADRANVNLALAWCVQRGDAEEGLRICYALAGVYLASGEAAEGTAWLDRLLAIDADVAPGVRARAIGLRGELALEVQDFNAAREFALACLDLSQHVPDGRPATALRLLAFADLVAGRAEDALAKADAAADAARAMADEWEEGMALTARAAVIASQGHLAEAELAYKEALEVLTGNNGWGVAYVLYGLGQIAKSRGDLDAALSYYEEALAIYRQIDARPEMVRCLAGVGWIWLSRDDLAAARVAMTESMRLSLATGHRLAIGRGLRALAKLAAVSGELALAVTLCGAAIAELGVAAASRPGVGIGGVDEILDIARTGLEPQVVAELLEHGKQLTPYQAADLAARPEPDPLPGEGDASEEHAAEMGWPAHATGTGNGLAPGGAQNAQNAQNGSRPRANLTGRERQIMTLLARGLSNRAIAEELFISEATAARHIANIFGKLGVRSRAQVISWMASNWPDGEA